MPGAQGDEVGICEVRRFLHRGRTQLHRVAEGGVQHPADAGQVPDLRRDVVKPQPHYRDRSGQTQTGQHGKGEQHLSHAMALSRKESPVSASPATR